ncbi:hypothetical protein BGX38DRAFT_1189983 [Terfezia claveryi]|nr:hypothetical protein BGX38DRAFT_1189983 [Terfezia claveryi]
MTSPLFAILTPTGLVPYHIALSIMRWWGFSVIRVHATILNLVTIIAEVVIPAIL